MSFTFKRKEGVTDGLCRIARKQVDKALNSCAESSAESIHTTRKQIKKLRALLRLACGHVPKKQLKHPLAALHTAAAYLAPPRDALVKYQAMRQLARLHARHSASRPHSRMQTFLKRECDEQTECFRAKRHARRVRHILQKLPRDFGRLNLKHEGWKIFGSAAKRSYRLAQNARDCALNESTPEKFHEWRKRVKDLLYTIQLLGRISPKQMSTLSVQFEKLTELLGDDHDLEMLRQTVLKNSLKVDSEAATQRLLSGIERRQLKLRKSALKLGNRLMDEPPSTFVHRLHRDWKQWKVKKRKRVSTATAV